MNSIIAPSLLASDWSRLSEEIKAVEDAGADWLHCDVMDGHFVPPITFGPQFVAAAKQHASVPLDVHLMIDAPHNHIEQFAKAGADIITVHVEAVDQLSSVIEQIKSNGCRAGVAVKPKTSIKAVEDVIDKIDLLLVMTVEPGWGGQAFIENSAERISEAAQLISSASRDIYLEVDGGINPSTAKIAKDAGANVFVAGTSVFKATEYREAIEALR